MGYVLHGKLELISFTAHKSFGYHQIANKSTAVVIFDSPIKLFITRFSFIFTIERYWYFLFYRWGVLLRGLSFGLSTK